VVNTLLDVFVEQHLATHRQPQSYNFFGEQVSLLGDRLSKSEQQLEKFRGQHNITAITEQKNTLLRLISERTGDLARTRAEASELRGRKEALQAGAGSATVAPKFGKETDLNLQAISIIRNRIADLKLKEEDLLSRYPETNTLVQNVRREIQKAESLLASEERTYHEKEVRSIEHNLEALRQREETQRQQLVTQQQELAKLSRVEIRLNEIERQLKIDEENYQLYVRKMEEGRMSEAMDNQKMGNISVAEPATPPIKPIRPRKLLNIALSVLFGAGAAVGAALAAERMGRTFNNRREVEEYLRLPVLASIPELHP
jgi:uncharacterized protein involved in exopolysaccharide biosynthesis